MEPDIVKRIKSDFGGKAMEAAEMLEAFEKRNELSPRVTRSIVHLAKGNITKLNKYISDAELDWRDVLFEAEDVDFQFNQPFPED